MKHTCLMIQGISKSYSERPTVVDVSLEIMRGEVVGLFGPNGAGKTTCFYIIAGLIAPNKGAVYLDEFDITYLPMYKRARLGIGYLPQESSIFRGLTVEENILAVLEIKEELLDKRQAELENLLQEFKIEHLRNTKGFALSGGERRRVEIARVLAHDPCFVIFDEPLAGIDPIAIHDIKEMISYLKQKNIGILITDHNVRDTFSIVDKAYIMYDGKILVSGDPSNIISHPEVKRVYLGENFIYNL
jgi:lipopolysaccharide export system ATP-binding protein